MATTEVRNCIRSMSYHDQAVALAVPIVMDRLMRLSQADLDDLFMLVKELGCAKTPEDRIGICDTMVEILDGGNTSLEVARLDDPGSPPEPLTKWNEWVSRKVKEARAAAALTQEQLAAKTGLPQSHISRIETAKHSPSRATIEKIANALGKPVEFFDFN